MTIDRTFRRRHVAAALTLAALVAAGTATTPAGAIQDSEELTGGGFIGNPDEKFTGGGFIGDPDIRVSLGFDLSCAATGSGSELQIDWFNPQPDPPGREAFRLGVLEQAACETGDPADRNDGGTHEGAGTGICHTQTGATAPARAQWRLTDRGIRDEENRPDALQLDLRSALPACNLHVAGTLDGGNFHMVDQPPRSLP